MGLSLSDLFVGIEKENNENLKKQRDRREQFTKDIVGVKYNTISAKDSLAAAVINPCIAGGPWIAGGAPLLWYQGKEVGDNDIDVFCRNREQADSVIRRIFKYADSGNASHTYRTDNATTISFTDPRDHRTEWKIQVITCKYFNSIQDVINSFDITVCQIATCGDEWILGPQTASDIKNKQLRFNTYTPDSPKRLTKYWSYGYTPVDGTIEAITSNTNTKWDFSKDEEYSNLI